MSLAITCPECQAKYRVKDELVGKRFRCKVCQAAVPVTVSVAEETEPKVNLDQLFDDDDASNERHAPRDFKDDARDLQTEEARETSTDLEVFSDTEESLVLTRSSHSIDRGDVRRGSHISPVQRAAIAVGRSAWVVMGLFFFAAWVPFSLAEPALVWWMNVVLIGLGVLGCVTGLILELVEVAIPDPLETVHRATVGELAGLVVSTSHFGPPPGRISGQTLARQCGWIIAFLAAHTAVLSGLKYSQVLPWA